MASQEPLNKKKLPETELDRLLDDLELTQAQRDFIESMHQGNDDEGSKDDE
ncbi:hypothetical protein [Citrobacter koseri]|uniref:hypothetical protein n=1 Tax=Citrobacter koseri TaxID=545 RepID=UPI0038916E23